jgi:serine/threonine protein kinase/CheY-like chemotaxis protein
MTPEERQLLVVDDNEVNRDMLSRRLARKGYQVETASNGHEALRMIENGSFDLILLDIMMPGLNGIEVLKILRQKYSTTELPIIMATAKDRSEDVVEALELGANDYVTKPIDFPVVLARVQSHLRTKAASPKREGGPSPGDIGPGAVLADKYLIEDKLGTGSFGTVYRGKHLSLQQPVAIKVLQTSMAPASEALARFRREGISACRVRHPNAVSVLDFGITSTGVAYLIMELLEGHSLAEELKEKGTLTPIRCAQILEPICEVLSEVHAQGMVHRDIKPANIFIHHGHAGEIVKVLDFGIAKLVGDVTQEEHLTVEGSILGTPTYMAPERFSNQPYDGRADVYSLGVLLYRMLGGRTPFHSKDLMVVAMQHLREAPRPLRQLNPMVTPELEAVVLHAMAKSMHDRPSATELAVRFGEAVGRRNTDVRPVTVVPSPETEPRRPPRFFAPAPPSSASPPAPEDVVPLSSVPPAEPAEPVEPTHFIDSAEIQEVLEDPRDAHARFLDPESSEREPLSLVELVKAFEEPLEEPTALEPPNEQNRSSMRKLLDKLFEPES